ncbi:induced myeloid leukemia cell differentiation protein Mcl-1 homolog [Lingula anatina]|uniref:Induced myeloid leukemia cell differentiation protein Mcl-1 homolog n=1 Tax=Lingula anatina TaxID=7574 RepID=A0A1S3IZP1_LINAN|nr:induced myeloid leukemia cell differentiation protein Mcl-1 homolog [Lingula anatina]|eukprot:XP_013403667.1 induced myeloid leukemia cell differentiation protein Mcl-1 homolog [Lingula anatina]
MNENGVDPSVRSRGTIKANIQENFYNNNNKMAEKVRDQGLNGLVNSGHRSTQTGEEHLPSSAIAKTAKEIAHDVLFWTVGYNNSKPNDTYSKTMRRLVTEILEKHKITFNGMMNKLDLSELNGKETVNGCLEHIFTDHEVNWGRVVTIYAFGSRLMKHCQENDMNTLMDKLPDYVGEYVATKLGPWIHKQGGWDTFVASFPDKNQMENGIWKGLLVTALGLGTLATMVAVR